MPEHEISTVEIKTRETPKPPSFGILLGLLAIGLLLATIRGFASLVQSRTDLPPAEAEPTLVLIINMAIGVWALVNLVLLLQRRKSFVPSMVAMLILNIGIAIVSAAVVAVSATNAADVFGVLIMAVVASAISALWLAYLLRSQHVQAVFVR